MNSGIENSMNGKKRAVTSAVTPHNINAKDLAASLDCCAECSVQYRCARRYVTMNRTRGYKRRAAKENLQ